MAKLSSRQRCHLESRWTFPLGLLDPDLRQQTLKGITILENCNTLEKKRNSFLKLSNDLESF